MLEHNREYAHAPHLQDWIGPEKISNDDTNPRSPSPLPFAEPIHPTSN